MNKVTGSLKFSSGNIPDPLSCNSTVNSATPFVLAVGVNEIVPVEVIKISSKVRFPVVLIGVVMKVIS
jgi:hypothetical protein